MSDICGELLFELCFTILIGILMRGTGMSESEATTFCFIIIIPFTFFGGRSMLSKETHLNTDGDGMISDEEWADGDGYVSENEKEFLPTELSTSEDDSWWESDDSS